MTKRLDTCLNLILPNALKDQVLDELLKHPEWVGPFTMHRVEGHGDPDGSLTPAEAVRGRSERIRIEILVDASYVDALLAELHRGLASAQSVWWLTPVIRMGSLQ